jgi:O-antigen/teichoic acid export membrane protein
MTTRVRPRHARTTKVRPAVVVEPSKLGRAGTGSSDQADTDMLRSEDNRSAARNGAMLGSSLFITASLGVMVSLFIVPRTVGETGTGILGFGEALATVMLVFAGFGMDTYLRKELATDRNHAKSFFSSVLVVRLLVTLLLTGFAVAVLVLRHQSDQGRSEATDRAFGATLLVVVLYCAAQFFQQTSESYAAMLQAVGEVRQQSRLTIRTKILWVALVVAGLALDLGLWVVPFALLITEIAKTLVLGVSAHRVFHFEWNVRPAHARPVIKAAAPFLVTALSVKVISWVDVALVKLITGDDSETGYYTIALRISALALLIAPLIQWVVLPLASRAAERSRDDFAELVRRSFQWVLCAGVPISLLLGLNADILIKTALQKSFEPAIPSLQVLSAVIALSYVSILGATLLIADGRSWRVVRITFITIAVDIVLNVFLIRHGWTSWGQAENGVRAGGAGVGAALALVSAEAIGASCYLWELRRVVGRVSDSVSRRSIASMLACCLAVIAVDRLALPVVGLARPLVDLMVFIALMTGAGVIRLEWYGMLWRQLATRIRPTGTGNGPGNEQT